MNNPQDYLDALKKTGKVIEHHIPYEATDDNLYLCAIDLAEKSLTVLSVCRAKRELNARAHKMARLFGLGEPKTGGHNTATAQNCRCVSQAGDAGG